MCIASIGIKLVLGLVAGIVLIHYAGDIERSRWHAKQTVADPGCPDVLNGPAMRTDWPAWLPFAEDLTKELMTADDEEGYDVLFYGDSISEHWRGSNVGSMYPDMEGIHQIFERRFNSNYTSDVMAIAGDETGHLWWRILNGQTPIKKHPKAIVVLIGTNDLTADDCTASEEASIEAAYRLVSRVNQILSHFRQSLPGTEIILLGLLPRDAHVLSGPPAYEWPNRMSPAIAVTNAEYKALTDNDDKMHFLDCGEPYVQLGGGLNATILPDALHPNTQGMDLLGSCIQPHLDSLVAAHES